MTDRTPRPQSPFVGRPALAIVPRPTATDFRALFEESFPYVVASLQRLGVPERDLEDVAHETFLVVHRRLADYDPARPLKPWLFGIAFRVASDWRRRAANRSASALPDDEAMRTDAPAADAQLEAHERRVLLAAALDTLDLDRRALIVMHDIDGVPVPEIAAALGIPLNTTYSRLRLARAQLTEEVRRRAEGGRRR